MLGETRERIEKAGLKAPELIRCDSARLPFKDESFDGIHAGAALHCWPRVSMSLSEVYRVLKPGGGFYASTILSSDDLNSNLMNSRSSGRRPFTVFPSVEYLEDEFRKAGFELVQGRREGRGCAILRAVKKPM